MRYFKFIALLFIVGLIFYIWSRTFVLTDIFLSLQHKNTVKSRLVEFGLVVVPRLSEFFSLAGVSYPPAETVLIAFKNTKVLEVWAADKEQKYKFIREYPILAASGEYGPKLQEGDMQVPEGIYRISYLNPNSMFHLSLKLNYPNGFDKQMARIDGRTDLGSDIMIHGSAQSIGCIAIGDEAIEDVFVLVAETGLRNVKVIISPVDFRRGDKVDLPSQKPLWTTNLYDRIQSELTFFQRF